MSIHAGFRAFLLSFLTYIFWPDKVRLSDKEGGSMKHFKTINSMVQAIKRDELPKHVISPGAAAAALGITRQSVHELCKRGPLPAWYAERVILIDADAVQARALRARGVAETQGDLYGAN